MSVLSKIRREHLQRAINRAKSGGRVVFICKSAKDASDAEWVLRHWEIVNRMFIQIVDCNKKEQTYGDGFAFPYGSEGGRLLITSQYQTAWKFNKRGWDLIIDENHNLQVSSMIITGKVLEINS